jgi:hypothetical protein
VFIGLDTSSESVTSANWSLGGTGVSVGSIALGTTHVEAWAIPAPVAGPGTYAVGFTNTTPWQVSADYFTGADQVTPCAAGDITTKTDTGAGSALAEVLTALNLTTNDASAGAAGLTLAGNLTSMTANQTYLDGGNTINLMTGYTLGTGALTANSDGTTGEKTAGIGVRIKAATLFPPWPPQINTLLRM